MKGNFNVGQCFTENQSLSRVELQFHEPRCDLWVITYQNTTFILVFVFVFLLMSSFSISNLSQRTKRQKTTNAILPFLLQQPL